MPDLGAVVSAAFTTYDAGGENVHHSAVTATLGFPAVKLQLHQFKGLRRDNRFMVNLYYKGTNGNARRFAEEMEQSGIAAAITSCQFIFEADLLNQLHQRICHRRQVGQVVGNDPNVHLNRWGDGVSV